MWNREFPIEKIKKGSRVVLYGAGKEGRNFWQRNQFIEWCEICAVIDKRGNDVKDFPVKVFPVQKIMDIGDFDYVIIAIAKPEIREEVMEVLSLLGISRSKIIDDIDYFIEHEDKTIVDSGPGDNGNRLTVGFHPTGGLGDYIIELAVYQEIVRLAPDCVIDVIAMNEDFAVHVYNDQKNIGEIIAGEPSDDLISKYDVFLEIRFEIKLSKVNFERVARFSRPLFEALHKLYDYNVHYYLGLRAFQNTNAVILGRARLMGWNRYTLYRAGGAFHVSDRKVELLIDGTYEKRFQELQLNGKYITFNYGANREYGVQTKMWPVEYHERLNRMLKEKFPEITLIQIGAKSAEKIVGADRYILDENLETTKIILKYALFHFDCEGGLVHMASQLNTKCFVVFGPTPAWFLGYENNTNILPDVCGECKSTHLEWFTKCFKYERPECMYSIRPERVFKLMCDYLEK